MLLYLEVDVCFISACASALYFEISYLIGFYSILCDGINNFTFTTCKNAVYLTKYTESYPTMTSCTEVHDRKFRYIT